MTAVSGRASSGSGVSLEAVASEFPVLRNRSFDGRPVVYLDSSATSQTPDPVIEAMTSYYTHSRASIHRGVYPLAAEATDLYEGARGRIAAWLGSTPEETVFTANATAAINMVAYTWGRLHVGRGDLVVLTEMEHHSNIVPWQLLCQDREAELAYVPVGDDGFLDMEALDALLARGPRLVGVVHVSNVLGTVNPVAEIARRAHEAGAVVLVDGTQAVPQMPVWLPDLDVDFYAGCVYNRTRTREEWKQVLHGEIMEMENEIYLQSDPARMYGVMRQTTKPCFAFKILAAGRIADGGIEQAFRTAFSSIKPNDGVLVGMFPRAKDEVRENAEIVHRILQG